MSAFSFSPCLHLLMLPVAPGLSLSISPGLHLPLIHSHGETHLGTVVCKQGYFFPNKRVRASFQLLYPALRKHDFKANDMKKHLRQKTTQTIYILIFHGVIMPLGTKVGVLLHCLNYSCCRHRENSKCSNIFSSINEGNMEEWTPHEPPPHPILPFSPFTPLLLYLFNHTEPYGCTACWIN